MKIGLLADLHGNGEAVATVLAAARRAGVERLLCAGDYVGYYYHPEAVLRELDRWVWTGVRGNHEDMLADWLAGKNRENVLARYGSGITVAADMPAGKRDRLLALPRRLTLEIDGRTVVLCHGAPWATNAYVYPDAPPDTRSRMAVEAVDVVVFGHSHFPVLWRERHCLVVNPGSVGQPRDRVPGACWALWDTSTMTIDLRRESYDTAPLVAECRRRDRDLAYLANVLTRTG